MVRRLAGLGPVEPPFNNSSLLHPAPGCRLGASPALRMNAALQSDYDALASPGNIAFYESCEVTQVYLFDRKQHIYNVFILACFEEKPFTATKQQFLTAKPLQVSDTLSLGVQRYWLSLAEAAATFQQLGQANEWNFGSNKSLKLGSLNGLPKQFVPSSEGVRLNAALKNNFGSGAYVLEFFDERKPHVQPLFALDNVEVLNRVSEQLRAVLPLDLSVVRERLGNVLFQFPIRLLVSTSRALPGWNGVQVSFRWHPKLAAAPACLLQVEAELDQLYLGSTLEAYTGAAQQQVMLGNLDGLDSIRIWRTAPSLLLSQFKGTYLRDIDIRPSLIRPEPREFHAGGQLQNVQVRSADPPARDKLPPASYRQHIDRVLYTTGRERLEQQLAFKQYFKGQHAEALTDLRTLLNRYGGQGAWLWDPYLSAENLLATLFHCQYAGVALRAIGSDNPGTKEINGHEGRVTADVVAAYHATLTRNTLAPAGRQLEFRLQHGPHGWKFHDRFLIFPATATAPTRAYSLGTSVNSLGNSHHVLQEVSHPQRVADAFQSLWNTLTDQACLVWKL